MRERVRARFFPQLPGAVLFFIPPGLHLDVQGLGDSFGEEEIARACGDVQISEAVPGRWTSTIVRARAAAKAERCQRHMQQEATEAAILRGSMDPRERDRAALLLEKQKVDSRAREIKKILSQAKARAALTGQYMSVTRYRDLEIELEAAKQKSQAIQTQLGLLREAAKAENVATRTTLESAFMTAAREMLHEEDFEDLMGRAREILEEMEAEAAARKAALTG